MRKTLLASVLFVAAVGGGACLDTSADESSIESLARLSGAIFTTTETGNRVDANIYELKEDVYLDGGPGLGAPASAACLPAGSYYFMVTDPPGKTLLSTSALACRRFNITSACTVDYDPGQTCTTPHATGTDVDHGGDTIQLLPYNDTPNNGGEYKVWVTPTGKHVPGSGNFGFINADSKTDNFKVRESEVPPPPCCGDGKVEAGEQCDDGNTMDGDGCSSTCQTEVKEPCCGDGTLDDGEQCDDGNTMDGDHCSSTCRYEPYCGDGVVNSYEQCDDGNEVNTDSCSNTCVCNPV